MRSLLRGHVEARPTGINVRVQDLEAGAAKRRFGVSAEFEWRLTGRAPIDGALELPFTLVPLSFLLRGVAAAAQSLFSQRRMIHPGI